MNRWDLPIKEKVPFADCTLHNVWALFSMKTFTLKLRYIIFNFIIHFLAILFDSKIFIEWWNKTFRHHNLHSFSISGKVIGYPHCFVSSFSLKRHISLRRFASRHASITHLERFPRLHSTSYVCRKPNRRFLWCNLYLKLSYKTFRKDFIALRLKYFTFVLFSTVE